MAGTTQVKVVGAPGTEVELRPRGDRDIEANPEQLRPIFTGRIPAEGALTIEAPSNAYLVLLTAGQPAIPVQTGAENSRKEIDLLG